jgi:hypothetical protein
MCVVHLSGPAALISFWDGMNEDPNFQRRKSWVADRCIFWQIMIPGGYICAVAVPFSLLPLFFLFKNVLSNP